ncbi:MAG: hypothetical protein ACP5FK_11430 [bacterium]
MIIFLSGWNNQPIKSRLSYSIFFFFSFIEIPKRKKIISYYLDGLNRELNELVLIEQQLFNQKVDCFAYQNLLYGIEHINFLINWFKGLLGKI